MKIEQIEQYIKTHCSADDYSLHINNRESHETRFAQNAITQHIAGPEAEIMLNVSFGTRSGACMINHVTEANLDYLIQTAEAIAKMAPEDPEFIASAPAAELAKVNNCAEATLSLSPQAMVDIVQKSIDKAIALNATVSGMCEKHIKKTCLITKNGFKGYDKFSRFGHSMTIKKGEVETKVSYEAKDFAPFNLEQEFSRLAAQAEALSEMKAFDPGKIAVILRPEALQELLWYLAWGMQRRQADEGLSPFTGQLDKPCFGEKFNLYSTLKRPEMHAPSFNGEGIPSREITWVESGVLKAMNCSRYWAKAVGAEPLSMYNFYIPGEDSSEDEMMQLVPRGLIINRFWYIRPVDMKKGELTGMTRDGVLYFEAGKVRHAVNNLRFNEIPHEMTRRVLALGSNKLSAPSANLPTMLIDDFNFVDKTSF